MKTPPIPPSLDPPPIDMNTTSWSRQEVVDVASWFRDKARGSFLECGKHIPIAFLFATRTPGDGTPLKATVMVPAVGSFDEGDKEGFTRLLRVMAHGLAASGIIFITEVWMLRRLGITEKDLDQYRGKVHLQADREEFLMMTCEHSRFGAMVWLAPILRPNGPEPAKPELGPWMNQEDFAPSGSEAKKGSWKGRFIHILPQVD